MNHELDWSKIRLGALAIVLGLLSSYFGQPLVHGNEQAINLIVTVFSVLAGFLVAVIAIVGDPVLLPPGTWRAAEMEREKLNNRLIRHKWLFMLYLITLALIFFALLLKDSTLETVIWLERGFLFFGAIAFSLSLVLPEALMKVQRERIDAVIKHRRKVDNVQDIDNNVTTP